MKFLDAVFIITAFLIGAAGLVYGLSAPEGSAVNVKTPSGEYRYSLSVDQSIVMNGSSGKATLQIKNGRARIVENCCPGQICVARGWISKSSESLVCVPNKIIVTIESPGQEVDAVTE